MKMNISIIMKMNMDQKPKTSISPRATRMDGKGAAPIFIGVVAELCWHFVRKVPHSQRLQQHRQRCLVLL